MSDFPIERMCWLVEAGPLRPIQFFADNPRLIRDMEPAQWSELLCRAVNSGNPLTLAVLLRFRKDIFRVSAPKSSAFRHALLTSEVVMAGLLLLGTDGLITEDSGPIRIVTSEFLKDAIERSQLPLVKFIFSILPQGTVNQRILDGPYPLFLARTLPIAKLLVETFGANPNQVDDSHEFSTPLICALSKGDAALHVAGYLLNHAGADPNLVGPSWGITPLHVAAIYGDVDWVKRLLNLPHLKIDVVDSDGNTPLHSIMSGDSYYMLQIGRLLVKAGVSVRALNRKKRTAFHSGCIYGASIGLLRYLYQQAPNSYWQQDYKGKFALVRFCCNCNSYTNKDELLEFLQWGSAELAEHLDQVGGQLAKYDISLQILAGLGLRGRDDIPEEEAAEIRYQVYFSRSLTYRLLFTPGILDRRELERPLRRNI